MLVVAISKCTKTIGKQILFTKNVPKPEENLCFLAKIPETKRNPSTFNLQPSKLLKKKKIFVF